MNQIHLNESPVKCCQNVEVSKFIVDQVYNCMMVNGRTQMVYIETKMQRVFTSLREESSFFESVAFERFGFDFETTGFGVVVFIG